MFVEIVRFVFTVLGALAGYQTTAYLQRDDRLAFLPHGSGFVAYALLALLGGLIGFVLGGVVGRLFVRLLERMPRECWEWHGLHSERGRETVARVVEMLAGHDLAHLRQIRGT